MPQKFEVGKNDIEIQGVIVTIDSDSKKCVKIERIKEKML
jgi:calcineurin-like phosphoesterase